jgi:hypothetical protein
MLLTPVEVGALVGTAVTAVRVVAIQAAAMVLRAWVEAAVEAAAAARKPTWATISTVAAVGVLGYLVKAQPVPVVSPQEAGRRVVVA